MDLLPLLKITRRRNYNSTRIFLRFLNEILSENNYEIMIKKTSEETIRVCEAMNNEIYNLMDLCINALYSGIFIFIKKYLRLEKHEVIHRLIRMLNQPSHLQNEEY